LHGAGAVHFDGDERQTELAGDLFIEQAGNDEVRRSFQNRTFL
jgi:hypothetical protein